MFSMYLVRLVLVVAWFFGFSLLFLPVAFLRPFNPNNSWLYCRCLSVVGVWLMGVKYEIRGSDQLDSSRPCVFVINHQSLIDVFFVGGLIPQNTVSVGKSSLRWIPLFGWIFWLGGNLFINRRNRSSAMATMKKAEEIVKEKGLSVLIAPEGTRSLKQGLLPFKRGAFHLAVNTGLKLQPIAITSFHNALNYWRWNAGKVIAEALAPIPVEGKTIDELTELSHAAISLALERLNKEV